MNPDKQTDVEFVNNVNEFCNYVMPYSSAICSVKNYAYSSDEVICQCERTMPSRLDSYKSSNHLDKKRANTM